MSQHEIDEAEREAQAAMWAIDEWRRSPQGSRADAIYRRHKTRLHTDITALASIARAAEERADKQANDFDVLSQQYLKRAEAAEAHVRKLEALVDRLQDEMQRAVENA